MQDRRGFIWIGTEDGLDRYDGYRFHRVAFPESAIHRMDVMDLFEDSTGNLWAATRDGLVRYDPKDEGLTFFEPEPKLDVQSGSFVVFEILEHPQGTLWLASPKGLLTVDPIEQQLIGISLEDSATSADPADNTPSGDASSASQTDAASETAEPPPPTAVYDLAAGEPGTLWLGTASGLFHYSIDEARANHRPFEAMAGDDDLPVYRLLYRDGALWIGTFHGLWRLSGQEPSSLERIWPVASEPPSSDGTDSILVLLDDTEGDLWFLTPEGLHQVPPEAPGVQVAPLSTSYPLCSSPPCLSYPYFNTYHPHFGPNGDLWIATHQVGLFQFDAQRQTLLHHRASGQHPDGLASDVNYGLEIDRQGILWIAGNGGLDKWDARRQRFRSYSEAPHQGGLVGVGVWAIFMQDDGSLWLGSYDNGFSHLDRRTGQTRTYAFDSARDDGLADGRVAAIQNASQGRLWIGSDNGLQRFDPRTDTYEPFSNEDGTPGHLSSDQVLSMARDLRGQLWIGTDLGVDIFQPDGETFQNCWEPDPQRPLMPYWLAPSGNGGMWAASLGQGLVYFAEGCEQPPDQILPEPGNRESLASESAVAVYEDDDGIVWVGFENAGLDRWDPERRVARHYTVAEGLPSSRVLSITEDSNGFLWLATGRGLSRFDKVQGTFRNFDVGDGLLNNAFTIGSVLEGPDGEIFFGGGLGLTAFHPEDIVDDPMPPDVRLTDFQLFYESASLASEDPKSPLQQAIGSTDALTLTHRQYIFGVEMTPLHFANPAKNRLRYQLRGFNEHWVDVDPSQRLAQFSNLHPGDYALEAQAANGDGVWSPTQTLLRIHVLPPPWKTWWAYTLYALALGLALWGYASWHRQRLRREQEINRQLREVDRLKDEFLANTSHELRTPLYGITGLAESLLEGAQGDLSQGAQANLRMIVSSGQRLASLVGQILDYSKVEQGKMEVDRRPVDLSTLLEVVLAILQPLLKDKDVRLLHRISPDLPPALADEDRLHQIFINLVGNAIKFTERGEVEVSAVEDDAMLIVHVRDTGIGIPEDRQEQIFEAFEQADASIERQHGGTGLGLAVTRELVTLLGGKIWVESRLDEGSTFTFTLPVAQGTVNDDELEQRATTTELEVTRLSPWIDAETHSQDHSADLPSSSSPEASRNAEADDPTHNRILVVDDESVLREVLFNFLKPEGYEVELAADGQEGLDLLALRNFDLVLLDVMMPRMSGFEVCARIRRRFAVEELPVIFLTAKNQVSDLVRAFGDGASDYLTKPIARQELLARVRTHLQLAESHRQQTRQVNILTGLLPICASCKRIRDDEGKWQGLETFIHRRTEASFSHSICPTCIRDLYPDLDL